MKLELHVYAQIKVFRDKEHLIFALPERIYVMPADTVQVIKKRKFARTEPVLRREGVITGRTSWPPAPAKKAQLLRDQAAAISGGAPVDTGNYITVPDAALRLGLSRQRVHQFIHANRIEAVQVGEGARKSWLVNRDALASRVVGRGGRPRKHPPRIMVEAAYHALAREVGRDERKDRERPRRRE